MARYQWPGSRDPESLDQPRFRAEALFERFADVPGEILAAASAARSALLAALAALSDVNVWLPIGPSVAILGQAGGLPHVAGRVRDLAVSDNGQRAYAAAANGGVWYTADAGTTWSPLGAGASTPTGEAAAPGPISLVTSCLCVKFGASPDGSQDIVYAGTGEIRPYSSGFPGSKAAGIGVLKLTSSLPDALAHPDVNPWQREANNLSGMGIFRIAMDPTNPDTLIAATSGGLFKRQGAFVAEANWPRVTEGPFDFDADDDKWCTDVRWEPAKGGVPSRLWVALIDDTAFSDTGIWVSESGVGGSYEEVALEDRIRAGRLGLSVHKNDPSTLYVLGQGPKLWRIDGKTARKVRNLPSHLFGDDNDQSDYDLCVEAHPTNPNLVIVGGSTVEADDEWSASLFRLTISGTAAANDFSCNFDQTKQATPGTDAGTYIGNGVHADMHVIRFAGAPAGSHVWVGCDGGVYRSTQSGDAYTFIARNNGLAVLEPGFVANHPTMDGAVLVGTQDNGALRRIGDTIWTKWIAGDGGGVAFHPTLPAHHLGQYTSAHWRSNDGSFVKPVWRIGSSENSKKLENWYAAFYSDLHVIPGSGGTKARIALGTNRVWISEDWDPDPASATMTWATLPSGTDPRLAGANNVSRDALDSKFGSIRVVLWAGKPGHVEDRVIALCRRALVAFNRDAATGKWSKTVVSRYEEKCGDDETDNDEIGETTNSFLPALGAWSDIAIHDPDSGTHGSYYVSTTGHASFDDDTLEEANRMDTLWWFDGTNTWHHTGLRNHPNSTRAPAFSVVVDPDAPGTVYAGSSAGVWKGQLTFAGTVPQWSWQIFSNGLPDAFVQDLAFFKSGDLKLLRAAMQARGVWEVDLSTTPGNPRLTFLRATALDTRRRAPTILTDPFDKSVPPADLDWHASPDIKFRPAPGVSAALDKPATLGWTKASFGDAYDLWVLQTAMHADDPLVRPTGKWTEQFDARVKAYRATHSLSSPATAIVDDELWDDAVVTGKAYANPWDGPEATEADLHELILNQSILAHGANAIMVDSKLYRIDVLVHHRHFQPLAPADVKVLLLRRQIADAEGDGGAIAISAAWKTAVVQRLTGAAPALPDGWEAVGVASPTAPVAAAAPRAVSFDVDFAPDPPFAVESRWIFLAVASATMDAVSEGGLAGGTIRDLVLNSHHVAARLIYVFI